MSQPPRDSRARLRRTPAWRTRSSRRDAATKNEEALRAGESRFEAVVEGVTDGVVTLDESGAIAGMNSAAARLFGYGRSELTGVSVAVLMPERRSGEHHRHIADYLRTGQARMIGAGREVEGRRKDGSSFPMELTVNEARFAGGRVFVGVIRDLTERRKTEALLEDLQAELTYAYRLTAMGELASALAHEISQPFAAIATYVTTARWLLQRKPKQRSADVQDILDKASAQVMRAGEIIRHLREFVTRGESVKTVQRLSALVDEANGLAFVGARQAGVRVTIRAEATNDHVLADRIQIQQVIVNLMRNAVEAMNGSPKRELVLSTSPAAGGLVRLDVVDTGHGFSKEAPATLFEPFKTTKPTGMGVGLSISRSIIEAHGGKIWAEPNPRGGAIFSFTLPLVETGGGR